MLKEVGTSPRLLSSEHPRIQPSIAECLSSPASQAEGLRGIGIGDSL